MLKTGKKAGMYNENLCTETYKGLNISGVHHAIIVHNDREVSPAS